MATNIVAQKFADREYYLVDSLVLEELSEADLNIVEASMKDFHGSKNDTGKIKALDNICENMMHEDWRKYQFYQLNLIKAVLPKHKRNPAKHLFLNTSFGKALNNIGFIFMEQGEYNKALEYYEESINYSRLSGDKVGLATTINNMAIIYDDQGNIAMALEYYNKSLYLFDKIGNKRGSANAFNNLGLIYLGQKELESALNYFQKSASINLELDNKLGLSQSYNNIGLAHEKNKNSQKSIEYYKLSLKYATDIGSKRAMAQSSSNLGGAFFSCDSLELATKYMLKSIKLRKEINDNKGLSLAYAHIGRLYLELNVDLAEKYGSKGFDLATTVGSPNSIQKNANLLHFVYQKQGQDMKALEMYKLHIQMRDSINNEETQKATIRQQTQYEFEKEQIRKENEAKEQARIEEEETSRRNNMQYSLIFLGILLLFGGVLSLGFVKVSANVAEGLIFFAFLILFEFVLVFTDPYLEQFTDGEPMYNLAANALIALLIFPLHDKLETVLKKRIVK
jgi:tetratricopeptide (TPR) repeat protein